MSGTSKQLLNRMLIMLGAALVVATGVVFADHESQGDDAAAQQPAGPAPRRSCWRPVAPGSAHSSLSRCRPAHSSRS